MVDYLQLLVLGAVSGFTIFLGLPLAVLQNVSTRKKGFLNALSIGILVFLVVDVFGHAWDAASGGVLSALSGGSSLAGAVTNLAAMFGGLAVGLLGLVWYESRYMPEKVPAEAARRPAGQGDANPGAWDALLPRTDPYKVSMMIALSIGAHNLSEGLAIGQSYASGSIGLALLLIIGFGAHNATEGFGIAGPLTGLKERPTLRFLTMVGLVGGGPTFLGTMVGSLWSSPFTYILFLSLAGGALVYVSLLMYGAGRRQTTNGTLMAGIFVGLCIGFITDLIVTLGGA